MMLEKQIEHDIISFLKFLGAFVWKANNGGVFDPTKKVFRRSGRHHKKGVSDIVGIYQGRFLAIEVKAKKGVVSPEQRIFLAQVNSEGGIGFIARSVNQCADQLVSHFPKDERLKKIAKEYQPTRQIEQ